VNVLLLMMKIVVGATDGLLLLGEDPLPPVLALHTPLTLSLSLTIHK
jgi:hypothetical protein